MSRSAKPPELDAEALEEVARQARESHGLKAKAEIGAVAERLGLARSEISVGDDCAAIPDSEGHLLFAIEGFINGFVAADPWFAGWCSVMVNVSDIASMGGWPIAVVDAIWAEGEPAAEQILEGMKAASAAYAVPIVGGHSNLHTARSQLAMAIVGRAGRQLLTSFDARPDDILIAAIDHRGAYREPFDNWQAALSAPHERLRADLALLPQIARDGLAHAAKDISQGGIPGTAAMLAECSGVGIDLDVEAIVPPPRVPISRWLKTFPSFGFLLATEQGKADALLSVFRERNLNATVIGKVNAGSEVALVAGAHRAVIRDWRHERLLGFAPVEERAA
jgi:AIR synthase-related protein